MATVKLILHKSWKRRDGTFPIVLQILHSKQKKIIYTGYRATEHDFDPEAQKVYSGGESALSERAAQRINREIRRRRKLLLGRIAVFEMQGIEYGVGDIDEHTATRHNVFFMQYMESQIRLMDEAGRTGTAQAYIRTGNSLRRFLNKKDIHVSEITTKFIRNYENHLIGRGLSPNTIAYYLRNLKTIYNRIVQDGFRTTALFPFKAVKSAPCKTPKRAIPREKLIRIAGLELQEEHLRLARDIFMFSFYCRGMAFVDMAYLRRSDLVAGTVCYSRRKSGQPLRIAIVEPLRKLVEKYSSHPSYVLPLLDSESTQPLYMQYRTALRRINDNLKTIGERAGLAMPLTTYIARHTWATEAKNRGTPISFISEGLGHASERNTRIYLKGLDTSIIDKINEDISNLS